MLFPVSLGLWTRSHRLAPRPKSPAGRAGSPPCLEALEDRALPSTFTVLNLDDSGPGSLRQAVLDANANPGADTIRFAAGLHGTITLTSDELSVTDSVTIDGPGQDRLTVSGNHAIRVFHLTGSSTDVAISGLTIADGLATGPTVIGDFGPVTLGGGILNLGAHLTLSDATLTRNQVVAVGSDASAYGGGIANVFGATLTVRHADFLANTARGDFHSGTPAIVSDIGSPADLEYCTFVGNQATDAKAGSHGGAVGNYDSSPMTIRHCTFANNLARGANGTGGAAGIGFGGAIETEDFGNFSTSPVTVTVEYCVFTGNQARSGDGSPGGAGVNGGSGGQGQGGAINLSGGGAAGDIRHCVFTNNLARGGDGGDGGAGANGGNGGVGYAGAISLTDGTLTLTDSSFIGNQAIGGIGGAGGDGGNGGAGGTARGAPSCIAWSPRPSIHCRT